MGAQAREGHAIRRPAARPQPRCRVWSPSVAPDAKKLAFEVVKRGLSVRDTERLAKRQSDTVTQPVGAKRRPAATKDADTIAIEADLSANLGMIVAISHHGPDEGGALTIKYRTLDDLDLLCEVLSRISMDKR